ncbi:DNA methyltransferase [Pedobacter sp. R-06]|uniref:DNA methyltransferase n=1 Tax=Pedobacter sp. R-06 TaxID=3404051 RepID=UPI003CF563CA
MINKLNDDFALKNGGFSDYGDTVKLARHRWYYYKEGFSPLLVEKAIESVGMRPEDYVIDPFNGSGTTTLSAAVKGYNSIGIEVNPFTSFLSDAKLKSANLIELENWLSTILVAANKTLKSPLLGFSTFSQTPKLEKWLFNDSVLNAFEGGWISASQIPSYNLRKLMKLALINSAMDNCNATRDGKCLRYRPSWTSQHFDKESFISSLIKNINIIKSDIETQQILAKSTIINGDARKVLSNDNLPANFRLCITSPPYLNTFDYTDIYRPELFLGKFIKNNPELYKLRLTTVRSHVQAKWDMPISNDFGLLYQQAMSHLAANPTGLMHKNIPVMVQAYFEDMLNILKLLRNKAAKDAELWLVVSNSAYADMEIPVDLIIGELGTRAGWFLKEIGVMRYIHRRKTKHSPNVNSLRESVVIFTASKIHR